jgi:AcrR family transcriptional regulator
MPQQDRPAAASIPDIAALARVNNGLVFWHFGNTTQLVLNREALGVQPERLARGCLARLDLRRDGRLTVPH